MADKTPWMGGRLGAFHLGRRYKDIGADLGRFYEAHHIHTGAPAMVLMLGAHAEGEPSEAWRVRVSSHLVPPHVVLEVEQAPSTGTVPELSAMLDLLTSAVERVETRQEVRLHLTQGSVGWWRRWTGRLRRLPRSRWVLATTGLVTVAVGVALWIRFHPPSSAQPAASGVGTEETLLASAPHMVDNGDTGMGVIAYPLPAKPFRDQATPPCKRGKSGRSEVEINGGCWVELARRPPCEDDDAEYQGKCYLPVSSDRSRRLPQSIEP
jgi:hypothetical protein